MASSRASPASSSILDRCGSRTGFPLSRLGFSMAPIPSTKPTAREAQAHTVGDHPTPAMHNIPKEILQGVFFFAVSNSESSPDLHRALHSICSVDREWRNTAINHPALWTRLPPAKFGDTKQTAAHRQKVVDALALYIDRSGALPISFTLRVVDQEVWTSAGPAFSIIVAAARLLADQSHRWDEVELGFTSLLYQRLVPIKGKLPLLTKLKFETPSLYLTDPIFDIFGDAPRLRNIDCSIHWCSPANLSVKFPWSQLERFAYSTKSAGLEVYHILLDSQPTSLSTLEYRARSLVLLPTSVSIPLPNLEKLVLRISNSIECDILAHLDALTLPALTHLELCGKLVAVAQDAYDVVRSLLERSGCSLQTLFLCLANNQDGNPRSFKSLIELCPELETLHLPIPEGGVLQTLILEPSSDQPLLPNLRTLGLHSHGPLSWDARVLENADLALVVESRTKALRNEQKPHRFQILQEVVFVYYANVGVQFAVLNSTALDDVLDAPVEALHKKKVEKALESLHWSFTERGTWLYRRRNYNPLFLAKMSRALRCLESLNFKSRYTEAVMRYGLPSILNLIGNCRDDGLLPSDVLIFFRARARRLVKKWKPFVVRDARKATFRWCYYGGGVVRMKYNHAWWEDIEENDEDIWNDILGIGEERSEYLSMKEWTSVI